MGNKPYLPIAIAIFLVATTGADLVARTVVANEPFTVAMRDHFYWAAVQFVSTLLLLTPFVAVAFVCARFEKTARRRSVALIFSIAMLTLLYFYFEGHMAKEHAMLEQKWTAAALTIGLLPFFIGIPVVLTALGAAALAAKFDGRMSN